MEPGRFTTLLALLAGCTCQEREAAPVSVALQPRPAVVLELGEKVSAADRRGGLLAVGTAAGRVLLARPGGEGEKVMLQPGEDGGHDGRVTVVHLSADAGRLLTVGGHVVMVWDTRTRRPVRLLRGPQPVTAGALLPAGDVAFFGTSHGHILRWEVSKGAAGAVRGFACGGTRVPPARMKLPEDRRCLYGSYVEPGEGPPACVYPVTHLVLVRDSLLRACRTGEAAGMQLETRRLDHFSPGHLSTLTALDDAGHQLLLGRSDGKLRLFDRRRKSVLRSLEPAGRPAAVAARGELIAAAQGRQLRLWHRTSARALAGAALPDEARWIAVERDRVSLLLADGRLVSYGLQVRPAR